MNITFLIGNGFDRALGLKTGYSHFYKWYCAQRSDSDVINNFRESIDADIKCTDENTVKLWSDAELGLAAVTEKYSFEDFVMCCEDMHDMLTEYLAGQDSKFPETDEQFNQIVQLFSSQLVEFQQDLDRTEQQMFTKIRSDNRDYDSLINIITLNYTRSCDKIHKALSAKALSAWTARSTHYLKMGKIVHAHGYVDSFPILGVCDPDLIANQQYLDNPAFRALMIKKESIRVAGETWRDDTIALINNSSIICVFGASLGASDSDYWKSIATWLNGGANRRLVIFWFDSNIKRTNISYYQKYVTKQKIQDKFLDFSSFDENVREQLRDRIHIVVNAPHMFVIPDELKVKSTEEKNSEALDKAIQDTIQELTSLVKSTSNVKEEQQASDTIDQHNASLPPMTVV